MQIRTTNGNPEEQLVGQTARLAIALMPKTEISNFHTGDPYLGRLTMMIPQFPATPTEATTQADAAAALIDPTRLRTLIS
jgi:hypothetical protein